MWNVEEQEAINIVNNATIILLSQSKIVKDSMSVLIVKETGNGPPVKACVPVIHQNFMRIN